MKLLALLLIASTASAGDFCGNRDTPDSLLRDLRRYAAGQKRAGELVDPRCVAQLTGALDGGDKYHARFLDACRAAVAAPARDGRLDEYCAGMVLDSGVAVVGARDLVAEWLADPRLKTAYTNLARTRDARVRLAIFATFESERQKPRRHHWEDDQWRATANNFLNALELIGLPEDLPLIDELGKDPYLKRRARSARAAIERAAKP